MRRRVAIVAVYALGMALGRSEITLTDVQGRKATVEVTEATPTDVAFVMQGRKGAIKISALSGESQAAVQTYATSKGVYRSFPPLTVQVKVAIQRRNSEKSGYETNVKLTSSVVLEGVAKLVPIPPAEAVIVLITQDTFQKYAKHVEKLKVSGTDKVSIPAAESGERREFPFQTVALTYDLARDPSNVGGHEYKYFVFGLRDAKTKQFVDFQTNCPAVQHYVDSHPEARDPILSAEKDAPFSPTLPVPGSKN